MLVHASERASELAWAGGCAPAVCGSFAQGGGAAHCSAHACMSWVDGAASSTWPWARQAACVLDAVSFMQRGHVLLYPYGGCKRACLRVRACMHAACACEFWLGSGAALSALVFFEVAHRMSVTGLHLPPRAAWLADRSPAAIVPPPSPSHRQCQGEACGTIPRPQSSGVRGRQASCYQGCVDFCKQLRRGILSCSMFVSGSRALLCALARP